MAKKKNKPTTQPFSPEQYIRTKARKLPIVVCYINSDWQSFGLANIMVVRQHASGNYTYGSYLVDIFCLGLKNSYYKFSDTETYFNQWLEQMNNYQSFEKISYEEAHNIIYGAIAFAEEAGIQPHKSFALTQYLLEEDDENVPLIEYEFGHNGKHMLVADNTLMLNRYRPLLEKNLGEGNFTFTLKTDDDEYDDDDDEYNDDDENRENTWLEKIDREKFMEALESLSNKLEKSKLLPHTEYTYVHPTYPTECHLENEWLMPVLYDKKHTMRQLDEMLDKILALPHDSLRHDLEQILLWETGRTCDSIEENRWDEDYDSPLLHCLFLLPEVGDEHSLEVVLETLRQNETYYDFHCGDAIHDFYAATIYRLGQKHLPTLLDYMMEEGLYTWAKIEVSEAVAQMAVIQPERRDEAIEWFRTLLTAYTQNLTETATRCDASLAGMITNQLIDIKAVELLPEIKALYDTGLVDEFICGKYSTVEDEMNSSNTFLKNELTIDLHERYVKFEKQWGK